MTNYKLKTVALNEIIEVDKKLIEPSNPAFSNTRFIGLENIEITTREYTEKEGYNPPASSCFLFDEKHVLYGKLRPYLNKVHLPDKAGKCSMEILPLLPKNGYNRGFVAAIMQSEMVMSAAVTNSTGGRMPRADMGKLLTLKVTIPGKVEDCNLLGIKISKALAVQKGINKTAEKQEEAVNSLQDSILREVFPFKEGDKLPDGWVMKRLNGKDGIATIVTGNTPPRVEMENYGGSIPWVKPEDLDKEMYIDTSKEYLSDVGVKKARLLPRNSILISCIGNIGKMGIAKSELTTNQQINSLVLRTGYDPEYVYFALKNILPNLKNINTSLVAILNASSLGKIEIPIPPTIEEQGKIAEEISIKMENASKMRERVKSIKETTNALPSSLLRQAFAFA